MKHCVKKIFIFLLLSFTSVCWSQNFEYFTSLPKTDFSRKNATESLNPANGHVNPESKFLSEQELKEILESNDFYSEEEGTPRSLTLPKKLDAFGNPIPLNTLFYRELLSEGEKQIYDSIYNALAELEESVQVTVPDSVRYLDIDKIVYSVCYDNPEFFWWMGSHSYSYRNVSCCIIRFNFLFDRNKLQKEIQEFNSKSFPIIYYASLLGSDAEKIKYIHDYICESADYDYVALNTYNYGGIYQTAYSCVVNYKTVCAGFAKAYAYYLQQLGIPCVYVHSDNHAWNLLKYNGNYYQTDVCWDEGSYAWNPSKLYLISTEEMKKVESHDPVSPSLAVTQYYSTKGPSDKNSYSKGSRYSFKEIKGFLADIQAPELISFGIAEKKHRKLQNIKLKAEITDLDGNPREQVYQRERLNIKVTPSQNCYIAVLLTDAKGKKTWLPIKNNYVKANQTKILPDQFAMNLVVDSNLTGNEYITVYASDKEIGLPYTYTASRLSNQDLYFIMNKLHQSLNNKTSSLGETSVYYKVLSD